MKKSNILLFVLGLIGFNLQTVMAQQVTTGTPAQPTPMSYTLSLFDVCSGYSIKKNGPYLLNVWCPNDTVHPYTSFIGCTNPSARQRIAAGRIVLDITCQASPTGWTCTSSKQ